MFNANTQNPKYSVVDQVALSADDAIKSTQRVANGALDGLAGGVESLRHQVTPLLNDVGERASTMAHRSMVAVRESTQQLRDRAVRASDSTVAYIKDEPVKSVLIAAAAGAALVVLLSLLGRSPPQG